MKIRTNFEYPSEFLYTKLNSGSLNNGFTGKLMSRGLIVYTNRFFSKYFYPKLMVAYIELTNNCNLRCKMCIYSKMKQNTGYMSKSLFDSCVDQLSEIGIANLNLHFGGESLVHPHFKQFLEYAIYKRNHGKIGNVSWIDNGMLFSHEISDLVVDLGVDLIGFSIDGVGGVNDRIRLGASYPVIEKNIKYLIQRRGKSKRPNVYLSVCEYSKTEQEIIDVYREWIPFVDSITLIPSIKPDNTWERKTNHYQNYEMLNPPEFCSFPFETMAISWDGKVTGCCQDYVFQMRLGDATKEPLEKIWRGSKFRALRKAALNNTFSIGSPCQKCEFWKINFKPEKEIILDGKGLRENGYIYRTIKRLK